MPLAPGTIDGIVSSLPIVIRKRFVYNRSMNDIARDVNIAAVAELIGDASRAAMLDALEGKEALPAGELARRAGISPQTASVHLAKLVEGGLLTLTTHGRHRYYALASSEVAYALEALAMIAPPARVRSLRQAVVAEQLHLARTCYDHLAGKLGVSLVQALLDMEVLQQEDTCYQVTQDGVAWLTQFGLDLEQLRRQRRKFAYPCLDWSERQYHLAGSLGSALIERLFLLGWIQKIPSGRAIRVTEAGYAGLQTAFGITLE